MAGRIRSYGAGSGNRPGGPLLAGRPGELDPIRATGRGKAMQAELEADEVGASLKWATAKVERSSERGNGERRSGHQRQAERGDFNDQPPF